MIKQLKNHVEGHVFQNTSLAQFHINDHKVMKGQLYTSVRIEPTGPVQKTGEWAVCFAPHFARNHEEIYGDMQVLVSA